MIQFIFMLTHHDVTVADAPHVYDEVRELEGLRHVGFKDIGLPVPALAALTRAIQADGREAFLEVVSEDPKAELRSAAMGLELGVDWLLGGTHVDEVLELSAGGRVRYCPFPGRVVGHPSVLDGSAAEIAASAVSIASRPGVHGLDLLSFRHPSDPVGVTRAVVEAVTVPVIAAGSVDSVDRIRTLARLGAWGFTVGGAVFEAAFDAPPDPKAQLTHILEAVDGASGPSDRR